jgi:hypothetical protein
LGWDFIMPVVPDEEGLTVPWGNLRVEVVDAQLIMKGTPSGNYKFLARAWQAANDKAGEPGWIV